jgi:hypothetical protein
MSTGVDIPGQVVTLLEGFRTSLALGALISLFGVAGALTAVYLTDTRRMPSLGGAEQAVALEFDRDWVRKRWRTSLERPSRRTEAKGTTNDCCECSGLDMFYGRIDASLREETRNLRWRAYFLYPTLGAFIAATFAVNLLQAFLLGMLWPSAIGATRLARQITHIRDGARELVAENSEEQISRVEEYLDVDRGKYVETIDRLARTVATVAEGGYVTQTTDGISVTTRGTGTTEGGE